MLDSMYRFAALSLDISGKEVKRTMTAPPEVTEVIDREIVAAATLFHPHYSKDNDEWQSEVEWGTGHGLAKGELDYKKVDGGKAEQLVKVSGTLAGVGVKELGEITLTDTKIKISGEQTYDAESNT